MALMSEPDRRLLPAVQTIAKEDEVVMKDLDGELLTCSTTNCTEAKRLKIKLDRYHQLSTLSPSKQNIPMSLKFNTEPATPDNSSTPGPVTKTTEESDHSPGTPASSQFNFRKPITLMSLKCRYRTNNDKMRTGPIQTQKETMNSSLK